MQGKMLSAFREAVWIVVLLTVVSSTATAAEGAQAYGTLANLLHDAREFRVDLELSRCLIKGTSKRPPSVRGGFRVDAFMIQEDESVSFSTTHFTVRNDKTPVT